ncbi:MAG: folylpolyglutamate synthase/dihydrofolate synthase family protein, partial [Anaerolineaceae bacterium]
MMDALEQAYQDSLDFLYGFVDFSMKRHVDDAHRFFKLDRMKQMMNLLDNPQECFPSIHVAGTKGKGSVSSFCASACQAAGYKVGLYTSPHLQEFTERIQINGSQIDKASLIALVDQLRPLTLEIPEITTFELTTALGFLYFAQNHIDIAVIEVGLGGRLDATNLVNPLVSVITPISYDHTAVLGSTLTEIAYEKGGIIKPGKPVVMAPQQPEAKAELMRIALERQSPLTLVEQAYQFEENSHSLTYQKMTLQRAGDGILEKQPPSLAAKPLKLSLPLLGFHQVQNAATAVAALDIVTQNGFTITRRDIQAGFKQVFWPARFEILRKDPPVVIDSAHNGDSMRRLRQTLDEYFPSQKFILIFGASADKELDAMLEEILPRMEQVITTQSTHPRAADAQSLAKLIQAYAVPVQAITPAEGALGVALELAGKDTGILVTGSI